MLNKTYYKLIRNKYFKWDPVKDEYKARFADKSRINKVSPYTFQLLENYMGSLKGMNVLDLGGGAGNYSIKFLEHGSRVTWTDVSKNMMKIAKDNLNYVDIKNVEIDFINLNPNNINYLKKDFDLIFLRLVWRYSFDDQEFAQKILNKLIPGGYIYILTNNSNFKSEESSLFDKLKIFIYLKFDIKIGHPHPPVGKLKILFKDSKIHYYNIDKSTEELIIQKQI